MRISHVSDNRDANNPNQDATEDVNQLGANHVPNDQHHSHLPDWGFGEIIHRNANFFCCARQALTDV
jgi:hypothetical protein